jgi:hypothetical protein
MAGSERDWSFSLEFGLLSTLRIKAKTPNKIVLSTYTFSAHLLIRLSLLIASIKPVAVNNGNRSTMNIETHRHELAPVDPSHQHPSGRNDPLGQMLPPMLRGKGGLANIPQAILRQNLQPVLNALGKLDAELLLDLELTEHGPRLRDG